MVYISNRPGRARPGSTASFVPGYDAHIAENVVSGSKEIPPRCSTGASTRRRRRPSRRPRPHRRPLRARRRRLLLVPRPRGRPDQGRRDLGRAGRDRALPGRPPRWWSAPSWERSTTAHAHPRLRRRQKPLEEQELVDFARGHLAGHRSLARSASWTTCRERPPASSTGRPCAEPARRRHQDEGHRQGGRRPLRGAGPR